MIGLAEAEGYSDVRARLYWPNADMQRGAQSPRGQAKPKAAVLLGMYRSIADMQRRLHVSWALPKPNDAVQLGPYRLNADNH